MNPARLKKTIRAFMTLCLLAVMIAFFTFVWVTQYQGSIPLPFYRRGNWLVIGIYGLLLYIFTNMYGGYKIGTLRLTELFYSQLLSIFFVNILTYFQISLIARWFITLRPYLLMTVLQMAATMVLTYFANRLYFKIYPPRRMVLIYGKDRGWGIVQKMNSRREKFDLSTEISIDRGVETICGLLRDYEGVLLNDVPDPERSEIINFCYKYNIRTYLVPKITDVLLSNSDSLHLFDTPLMLLRNKGIASESLVLKRLLDLVGSALLLLLASPLLLLTALAVKLWDKGPVFYRQERLTLEGRVFRIYKFRSMRPDAEEDGIARLATAHDDRVTPVGKWLRRWRLDELPQLINVLKGDMSLVGPRPERPELAAAYEKQMPEFSYRLKVKAGITGYAQVLGRYNTTPEDKLLLDLMYIEGYSLILDLKLLFMTVKIMFWPESSAGVEEEASFPGTGRNLPL